MRSDRAAVDLVKEYKSFGSVCTKIRLSAPKRQLICRMFDDNSL